MDAWLHYGSENLPGGFHEWQYTGFSYHNAYYGWVSETDQDTAWLPPHRSGGKECNKNTNGRVMWNASMWFSWRKQGNRSELRAWGYKHDAEWEALKKRERQASKRTPSTCCITCSQTICDNNTGSRKFSLPQSAGKGVAWSELRNDPKDVVMGIPVALRLAHELMQNVMFHLLVWDS